MSTSINKDTYGTYVSLPGRKKEIDEISNALDAFVVGIPTRSIILSAEGWYSKTELLYKIITIAKEKGIHCEYIEADINRDFFSQFTDALTRTINPFVFEDEISNEFKIPISTQLTEILINMGKTARDINKKVCIFINEIQFIERGQLGALVMGLHRCNQLNLPVMIIGTGLPEIYKLLADTRSYSERMFVYISIKSVNK